MKLGKIINDYRKEHNMSMGDFAKLSGISKPYISMLEADKNSRDGKPIAPSVTTLLKVSKAIGIPLNDLMYMLGDEQYINLAQPTLTEKQNELIKGYDELTDDGQLLLIGMLNSLRQSHSRSKVAR